MTARSWLVNIAVKRVSCLTTENLVRQRWLYETTHFPMFTISTWRHRGSKRGWVQKLKQRGYISVTHFHLCSWRRERSKKTRENYTMVQVNWLAKSSYRESWQTRSQWLTVTTPGKPVCVWLCFGLLFCICLSEEWLDFSSVCSHVSPPQSAHLVFTANQHPDQSSANSTPASHLTVTLSWRMLQSVPARLWSDTSSFQLLLPFGVICLLVFVASCICHFVKPSSAHHPQLIPNFSNSLIKALIYLTRLPVPLSARGSRRILDTYKEKH